MNKLLSILSLFLLLNLSAAAQPVRETSPQSVTSLVQRGMFGKDLYLPKVATPPTGHVPGITGGVDTTANAVFCLADSSVYLYLGNGNWIAQVNLSKLSQALGAFGIQQVLNNNPNLSQNSYIQGNGHNLGLNGTNTGDTLKVNNWGTFFINAQNTVFAGQTTNFNSPAGNYFNTPSQIEAAFYWRSTAFTAPLTRLYNTGISTGVYFNGQNTIDTVLMASDARDNYVSLTLSQTVRGIKSFSPSLSVSTSTSGTLFSPNITTTTNNNLLAGVRINPTLSGTVGTTGNNFLSLWVNNFPVLFDKDFYETGKIHGDTISISNDTTFNANRSFVVTDTTGTDAIITAFNSGKTVYLGANPTRNGYQLTVQKTTKLNDTLNYNAPTGTPAYGLYLDAGKNVIYGSVAAGNVVDTVFATIQSMVAYSGSYVNSFVYDTVAGGQFHYYSSGCPIIDSGIVIEATGKGTGCWVRNITQANGNNPDWWYRNSASASPVFDPLTQDSTTGVDMRRAFQHAIDYYPHRNGPVIVTHPYLSLDSIQLGEQTTIIGNNTLFPYQLTAGNRQNYLNKSAIFFKKPGGSNGFVTTREAVTYRNQGIRIKNVGIFGTYVTGSTQQYTGTLLRTNPNKIGGGLTKSGLPTFENIYWDGWYIAADGRDSTDSWTISGGQVSNCQWGIFGGLTQTTLNAVDIYNVDSVGFVSNATDGFGSDLIINNQFETSKPNSKAIRVSGSRNIAISHNQFQTGDVAIQVTGGVSGSAGPVNIDNNSFNTYSNSIVLDSGASRVNIFNNMFESFSSDSVGTPNFIKGRYTSYISVFDNTMFYSAGNVTDPIRIDTSTNTYIAFNKAPGFATIKQINQGTGNTYLPSYFQQDLVLSGQVPGSGTINNLIGEAWGPGNTQTPSGAQLFAMRGKVVDNTNTLTGSKVSIAGIATAAPTTTSTPTRIAFSITPINSTTLTEQMNLSGSGLSIGNGASAAAKSLDINGGARFINDIFVGSSSLNDSAIINFAASSSTKASMYFPTTGSTPTTTVDGDFWVTSSGVKFKLGTNRRFLLGPDANWSSGVIVYGNGTDLSATAAGISGQVLTSAGTGTPTWTNTQSLGSVASAGTTGTLSQTMTGGNFISVTPTGNITYNAAGSPVSGATMTFIITTSGTTSYTVTFGTSFKSMGTITTGTVSGKVFTARFVWDGTNWNEISVTTAM